MYRIRPRRFLSSSPGLRPIRARSTWHRAVRAVRRISGASSIMTGIEMLHVPYRGGAPALTDLMGGQVQVYFSPLPESISSIESGKVRALAVTTAKRSEALPEVPTTGETISGFEASTWQGIGAPKGTPDEIVVPLNKKINAALADEKIKARLAELGSVPMPMSPADFAKLIADETEKWAKVIGAANIKPE